jgi:hypothetical protein
VGQGKESLKMEELIAGPFLVKGADDIANTFAVKGSSLASLNASPSKWANLADISDHDCLPSRPTFSL